MLTSFNHTRKQTPTNGLTRAVLRENNLRLPDQILMKLDSVFEFLENTYTERD